MTLRMTTAIVAPIGCSVSVEMNSPIAPSDAKQTPRYRVASATRRTAWPMLIWLPDSVVIAPPPKSASPATAPTRETHTVAASEKIVIAANFTANSLVRCTGTASR